VARDLTEPVDRLAPLVQALRGLGLVAATVLVAEIGDLRRFANPSLDNSQP
jgi:transposase